MKPTIYLLLTLVLTSCFIELKAQVMTPTYTVSIPMRDSKTLAADVYVPSSCTSCPTILIQTPYNKNLFRLGLPLGFLQDVESSPYVWVIVDWRGFYGSAAAAIASPKRGEDGYDIMDWIVAQSWSNDTIGTWGPSALGKIQYETAKENHPAHICAVPLVAYPQTSYESYFYGGVLEKSRLEQLDALGYGLSTIVLANPYYSIYWQIAKNNSFYPEDIYIPTLQIGGWYDHNVDGMIEWYEACRSSADISVRNKQWLLFGPWVHGGTGAANVGSALQGELSYPLAANESNNKALEFFDYYLRGIENNWEASPKISYYELGKDTWNTSDALSIASASSVDLYLNENNSLISSVGTGTTAFVSDPDNPSPTIGGPTLHPDLDQGPYDQISLEPRSDVVTFSTGILSSQITVSGKIKLTLYIEAAQPDADVAVRLVDVYPDGKNMLINDGVRRMRFRTGYTLASESFMTPGTIYSVEIDLPFVNYTWQAGHALKIYISGNNATRWDVNLQNGETMYTAGTANTATISLHHNASNASKITLPGTAPILTTVNKNESVSLVKLSPNPANAYIEIVNSKDEQPKKYTISNSIGVVMDSKEWTSNYIDIHALESGLYLFQLYNTEGLIGTYKFIKE